ncbi:MAG: hypothetical protein ACREBU_20350, partial [Nitrososphaera sp.]
MIVAELYDGQGPGNQLWGYAAARSIAEYDTGFKRRRNNINYHRIIYVGISWFLCEIAKMAALLKASFE